MNQRQAINMLSIPGGFQSTEQDWVDMGCGSGTFTLALAHYLSPGSRIIAVDKNRSLLDKIPNHFNSVNIKKTHTDFLDIDFSPKSLDGILLANSLHYIQNQKVFIEGAKHYLKTDACFLIVEYDTNRSNPWIPYPLRFDRLEKLFKKEGFSSIIKIDEKSSRYNRSNLYSAIIRWLPPNS